MAEAQTNEPRGAAYNQAMGDWLAEYELTDFDASDRARLLNYLENREAIESHFAGELDFKAYHPATIFKKWRAATQPKKPRQPKSKSPSSNLAVDLADALNRESALRERVAELEATAPADPTSLGATLTALLSFGRFGLKDLGDTLPNPIDLVEAAKNLTDIAADLKRVAKQAGKVAAPKLAPAMVVKTNKTKRRKAKPDLEFSSIPASQNGVIGFEAEAGDGGYRVEPNKKNLWRALTLDGEIIEEGLYGRADAETAARRHWNAI